VLRVEELGAEFRLEEPGTGFLGIVFGRCMPLLRERPCEDGKFCGSRDDSALELEAGVGGTPTAGLWKGDWSCQLVVRIDGVDGWNPVVPLAVF